LAGGFVKHYGGSRGGIERFDATGHGNTNARIGASLDFLGKARAFVADEQRHGLAPIDFPGSEERLFTVPRFVNARCERANAGDLELRQKNRKRYSGKNGKMQGRSGGSAQSFR